ncbi:hypothetical protein GX50_05112 [[Emmonsia] crescens]|uniref:Uncharacterized protein n=1 Tax=[Emmonsia] crescens TaxID=73230 RepID=A0A2B7ZDP5_9EURO|nr:hypothetical protein GX50_05112 [Emmonsia crescens]
MCCLDDNSPPSAAKVDSATFGHTQEFTFCFVKSSESDQPFAARIESMQAAAKCAPCNWLSKSCVLGVERGRRNLSLIEF